MQRTEGVADVPRVDDVAADLVGEHGLDVSDVGIDCCNSRKECQQAVGRRAQAKKTYTECEACQAS